MHRYAAAQAAHGTPLRAIVAPLARPLPGPARGAFVAALFSDAHALAANDHGLLLDALERVEARGRVVAA